MNSTTFAIFAIVYLVIALSTLAMPLAAAFYSLCFGASALKAVASKMSPPKPVRRSPFGYARA